MRAALALLITGGVAIAAGVLGFQAGVVSNIGAAGCTVVLGGGFPAVGLFMFLGFLFFSFLALAAILGGRRRHHGPWGMRHAMGPGAWGPGGPGMGDGTDPRRAWVVEMHRRLHEEEAAAASSATPAGSSGTSAGSSGTPAA